MSIPKGPKIIPTLRYRDGQAAIEFLCNAFGFEKHLVVPGEDGTITHAQLVGHGGMVMLGSSNHGEYDNYVIHPDETGDRSTASAYIIVEDVDAHHDRAVAAGARVVLPPVDQDYGGRGYTCLDPEGHVWGFGSYDPADETD